MNKCYFCHKKTDDLVSWENPKDKSKDIDYLFLLCPDCEGKLRELIKTTEKGPAKPVKTVLDVMMLLELVLARQSLIHAEVNKLWEVQAKSLEAQQKFFNFFLKGKWRREDQPSK